MKVYVTSASNIGEDYYKILEVNSIDEAIDILNKDYIIKNIIHPNCLEFSFINSNPKVEYIIQEVSSKYKELYENCDWSILIYDYYIE